MMAQGPKKKFYKNFSKKCKVQKIRFLYKGTKQK